MKYKVTLKKENQVEGAEWLDFKSFYGCKNIHTESRNASTHIWLADFYNDEILWAVKPSLTEYKSLLYPMHHSIYKLYFDMHYCPKCRYNK